ncbi:MAG TPA: hypothetical protein PK385_03565 [Spirochaetota bacterium]|nr:hypothetical protein [Spirochaetota bacterium]HOS32248.1 hypothetical protein [Spirochaetota bacterium]HOS55116.1 hypothetical protein [Spirochaetota bacterium]HPK61461.1 hypothetical protein [Spirochaetota bacterium]HQF77623.1 hypothetical protein [Spirochaetota bacterium]
MDEKLKEKLEDALKSGKATIADIGEIVKNITREVVAKSKAEGADLKKTVGELFKEIINMLGEVGKGSFEFLKAAGAGFMEGLKESGKEENNLIKHAGQSILNGLKSLGGAGLYVTRETAKNLKETADSMIQKAKEKKIEKKQNKESGVPQDDEADRKI